MPNFALESKITDMINREIIRVKVVQLTYAYYLKGEMNLDKAEKELFFSLSKAYDLYNYMLSLITAVTKESRRHLEVAKNKALREGAPLPSQKFADNKFAMQLEDNEMLNSFLEEQNKSWDMHAEFVRKLYLRITDTEFYKEYMASKDNSYEQDRELWRKIYRTLIQDNDDLNAMLEEESLYWNDDKDIVDTFVLKTIKRFDEKNGSKQELLKEYDSEDERDYARRLFRAAILNADEYQHYMSSHTRHWDFSRMAFMDIIIMQIAIAEIMTFSNIPLGVTINEYVELAKLYSTPRSGGYINGMLDSIARDLIQEGKVNKHINDRKPNVKKRSSRSEAASNERETTSGKLNEEETPAAGDEK